MRWCSPAALLLGWNLPAAYSAGCMRTTGAIGLEILAFQSYRVPWYLICSSTGKTANTQTVIIGNWAGRLARTVQSSLHWATRVQGWVRLPENLKAVPAALHYLILKPGIRSVHWQQSIRQARLSSQVLRYYGRGHLSKMVNLVTSQCPRAPSVSNPIFPVTLARQRIPRWLQLRRMRH